MTIVSPIRTDEDDDEAAKPRSPVIVKTTVARDTLGLERSLQQLAVLLGSVFVGAVLLSLLVLIPVVRLTLKPVAALATEISAIDAGNVSSRSGLSCSIAELDPVVDRLNELLGRLDKALRREKEFTAEVAHELRTPLAGLSAALEVCASRPRNEAAYRDVVLKCLDTTRTMQTMVQNLLTLARADAGQLGLTLELLDLSGFVRECWSHVGDRAEERGLRVEWANDARTILVESDREKLRLVVYNLFDNVLRHCNPGGTVTIDIVQETKVVRFDIRNTGCTLSPDDVGNVFDRFWKQDAARWAGADHCGLGLSMCQKIVQILGGEIAATVEDHTFAVRVMLPSATEAEG